MSAAQRARTAHLCASTTGQSAERRTRSRRRSRRGRDNRSTSPAPHTTVPRVQRAVQLRKGSVRTRPLTKRGGPCKISELVGARGGLLRRAQAGRGLFRALPPSLPAFRGFFPPGFSRSSARSGSRLGRPASPRTGVVGPSFACFRDRPAHQGRHGFLFGVPPCRPARRCTAVPSAVGGDRFGVAPRSCCASRQRGGNAFPR